MNFIKVMVMILALGLLLIGYMYAETYWIETKEVVIESSQIPANFDGKKIVFLSDIHAGPFFSIQRVDNLVKQVNEMHPDIILLGGDYTDKDNSYITPVFKSLSNLSAPLGVYGVLGNTDPQYLTLKAFGNSTITYIGNEGLWINDSGQGIRIGGVGDYNNGVQLEDKAIGNAQTQDFMVMVTHNPDYFPEVNESVVDLVLSGHTHGGQITFFGLWAPVVYSRYDQKYRTGVQEYNDTTLIVSNGVGTVVLPFRFFARPQIIVIKLKKID
jgi:predicted MPP superfamily phosphohydrolase